MCFGLYRWSSSHLGMETADKLVGTEQCGHLTEKCLSIISVAWF